MKILVYDLEIKNAIPPKDNSQKLPHISYCGGWHDFENMGISAISFAILETETRLITTAQVYNWDIFDRGDLQSTILKEVHLIAGFNSHRFDDRLLAANGLRFGTDLDIFEEVLEAAGQDINSYWKEGRKYSLDYIASANGLRKMGNGAEAPILYQTGLLADLAIYAVADAIIAAEILAKGLAGTLLDPNDGKLLTIDVDRLTFALS